ncbi:hypothetical protein NS365_04135 [Aureimonas ureilytica]|uniref:Peptidase C51 domain-containing protein n=1 Tax=Aureimonas ureilytica TaxID=401562 RepID=A0A175RX64_9HYPH|nr:TIGR02594 family protein [Aureimonas ureilytica]KTR07482.1 hypothetical protein NS365_04135 [Aureimonas ureilytica]
MATAGTAIDEIRIEGSSEGLDDLVRDLNDVTNAQDDLGRSTRETENITDRSTRTIAAAAKANERLARTLDDGYRRTQDYSRGVSILNRGLEQGVIDAQTYAHRMELLGQRFGVTNDNARNAGNQVRLTGGQVQNLGYQLNDVTTMLASGSSPFQVMATQAGQVLQALGDGPGGVRGSLAAIGSAVMGFMRGLGPAGLALGGVAVAATAFALVIKRDVKPIEDVIKRQEEAVRKLRDAYGVAGDAAEDYARRSPQAVRMSANDNYKEDLERVRKEASQKMYSIFGGPSLRYRVVQEQFEGIRKAVRAFNAEAKDGIPPFAKLEADLAQFETGGATKEAQALSKAIREWTQTYIPLEEKLRGVNDLMSDSAVRAMEMKKAYGTAMTGLLGMVPDLRTQAERINDLFADASKSGQAAGDEMVALYQKQRAMQPITDTANAAVREEQAKRAAIGLGEEATAIAEVVAKYDGLRASVKGNADAIAAYDKAQQEAIAGVKDQSAFKTAEEAAKKADEAAKKAQAQAKAALDATRARLAGMDATVRGLQTEAETLGMSEGAAAGYRFQVEALAAAKAAAGAQGVVSDEELRKIGEVSAAIARMTDNLAARREADAAIGQFFPLEKAAQEAERLQAMVSNTANGLSDLQRTALQLQIDKGFVDAQEAAERLRTGGKAAAKEIGQAFIENVGDVFADIFSSATRDGESFFASVMRGFAGIGSQLASAGAKNLFGSLFGLPQDKAAAGIGPVGSAPVVSGGGVRVGAVTSAPLAALNDNLAKTSRSALDVARQFQGLNERADSKVLDGFMRASGNWSGLSAKDTAWCAAFANAAIVQAGGKGTGSNAASSFMGWGTATTQPKVGDIVVLRPQSRGATGHVGFVAGFGDGTVQIFGGNQSNSAKVSTYSTREVVGYRTGTGTQSQGSVVLSKAEQQRIVEQGTSRGIQQAAQQMAPGFHYQNAQGQTVNHVGVTRGQQLMGGLGAGLGIFSSGYQGADPLLGGVSGALGGFQAASALGVAGPIGAIAGAALGLLGGALGKRKQREEAHRQAAAKWEEMLPQYREYQKRMKDGVGPNSGLRDAFAADDQALDSFMKVGGAAWKFGKGNSSAEFWQTGLDRYSYQERTKAAFRDSFGSTESSLLSGQGLEGPWVKSRDAIREAAKAMLTFADDAKVSFGEGSAEVERARAAGVTQLRSVLRGADQLTSIGAGLQSLEGGASALRTELVKLGLTSEEVARVVADDLTVAMGKMRSDFERGIADQVADLDGKSYLTKVRDLIETFRATQEDAARLGADTSLLPTLFQKQAQAIVDGADLSADALGELVKVFPQLSGVVRTSTTQLENAVATAQGNLRTAFDRVSSFVDSIRSFRDSIRLDSNLSTLGPQERLLEVQTKFRETSERAAKGDAEAQAKLIELGRNYLDESKSYNASSEAYYADFSEVQAVLGRTETAAMSELEMAKSQYGALLAIDNSVKSVTEAVAALNAAQAARDAAQVISLQQYVQALNPTVALPAAAQPAPTPAIVSTPAPAPAASAPAMEYRNGLAGRTFSFNGASVWLKQGGTFEEAFNAWSQEYGYYNAGIAPHFMTAWKQAGFARGGYTGAGGVYDPAGIVHRGEVVWSQSDISRWGGVRVVEALRTAPTPAMPVLPTGSGSDDGEIVAELRAMREALRRIAGTDDVRKLAETIVASDDETRSTIGETSEAERRRGASSDRLAARRATIAA